MRKSILPIEIKCSFSFALSLCKCSAQKDTSNVQKTLKRTPVFTWKYSCTPEPRFFDPHHLLKRELPATPECSSEPLDPGGYQGHCNPPSRLVPIPTEA